MFEYLQLRVTLEECVTRNVAGAINMTCSHGLRYQFSTCTAVKTSVVKLFMLLDSFSV